MINKLLIAEKRGADEFAVATPHAVADVRVKMELRLTSLLMNSWQTYQVRKRLLEKLS